MLYILPAIIVFITVTALVRHECRRLKKKRSGGYPYSRNRHQ